MHDLVRRIGEIGDDCGGTVSVAVCDIRGAFDLGINENEVVSSASIIKMPMLVEAMRQVRDGMLSLDAEFHAPDERVKGSGVVRYLHPGVSLTLKDLLTLMIIVSDNTATNMVMDLIGIASVNSTLRGMGLSGTVLQRKMYDWAAIERGEDNLCTAADMAGLLARIARREAVGDPWDEMMLDILRHQQDCDRLGMLLPEGTKLANKTGSREGIMHDCGIVTTDAFSYSVAVFTRDAKTRGDAVLAIARVSRAVYEVAYFRSSGKPVPRQAAADI